MEDKYSPVVVFVYNRPQHTANLLKCLDLLVEAPNTEMYIFSDGYKCENDDNVVSVREVIKRFTEDSHFKKVHVEESKVNKGLATSIIEGVSKVINIHNTAIVLEDDLEVSSDFLTYMNNALRTYEANDKIWSISAYSFPMKALRNYQHDVFLSGRGCSWGWATWKDRWNSIDWSVNNYKSYKYNYLKRKRFALWGRDMPCMLDAYMYGEIHSWAIRWCFAAHIQDKYTIYPVNSRILNKGTDGSGTNYNKSSITTFDTQLTSTPKCKFENVEIDVVIQKEFAKKYLTTLELIKVELRWLLIKSGVLHAHVK